MSARRHLKRVYCEPSSAGDTGFRECHMADAFLWGGIWEVWAWRMWCGDTPYKKKLTWNLKLDPMELDRPFGSYYFQVPFDETSRWCKVSSLRTMFRHPVFSSQTPLPPQTWGADVGRSGGEEHGNTRTPLPGKAVHDFLQLWGMCSRFEFLNFHRWAMLVPCRVTNMKP